MKHKWVEKKFRGLGFCPQTTMCKQSSLILKDWTREKEGESISALKNLSHDSFTRPLPKDAWMHVYVNAHTQLSPAHSRHQHQQALKEMLRCVTTTKPLHYSLKSRAGGRSACPTQTHSPVSSHIQTHTGVNIHTHPNKQKDSQMPSRRFWAIHLFPVFSPLKDARRDGDILFEMINLFEIWQPVQVWLQQKVWCFLQLKLAKNCLIR